jgi:hypothetical protein
MKQFLSIFLFLFSIVLSSIAVAQDHTVRGFLFNQENSEAVAFEKVALIPTEKSQSILIGTTDVNGFFTVTKVNQGTYLMKIQTSEFKVYEKEIVVQSKSGITEFRIELTPLDAVGIEEVVISAETRAKTTEVLMSQIKLDKKGLERIPSIGAENDIVGAFQVTPGVVTTGDQGGQLYVRGGTPIQNKILLDGMTIYNPFHSIGFFSIFETELVKNVDIYTGGFDSRFGGRISSIMDITYRDGNKKNFGGKVSVSPFLAKLVVEGPMYRAKKEGDGAGSFIFSAKHSLLDYISKDLYRGVNNGNGLPYNFTDVYGKMTFATGQGSRVSLFGFNNYDKVNYNSSAALDFNQAGGGLSWFLLPNGGKTIIKGHLTGTQYKTKFQEEGTTPRTSAITGVDLGFDFSYFLRRESQVDYGISINLFGTKFLTYNELMSKIEVNNNTVEFTGYANYKFVSKRFVVQPGFRFQGYASLNTFSLEPRLGIKYNATEKFRLKLSGGRYSQNFTSASSDRDIVNLFNGLLSAPTNVQSTFITQWGKTKTPKNGIQYAWHAIFGAEVDITKSLSLNVEGYYKYFPQLSNVNTFKFYDDVAANSKVDDIEKKDFLIESGQSYGVDVMLKFNYNRWFVWGVYSLAKSTRWNGFENYFPVFDRRHNANIVVSYVVGKKRDLEFNVRWNYGSGLPFTPTVGYYQNETFNQGVSTDITTSNTQNVEVMLGAFNSKRLPDYHRLDITIKKQFKFKNRMELELIAAVTNVYNRKNIFYVNRATNEKIYQFPILPSLGISFKF